MEARNPLRVVVTVLGITLCAVGLTLGVGAFAMVFAVLGDDGKCLDGFWCASAAVNVAFGLGFAAATAAAFGLLVAGGLRFGRRPATRAWLLVVGGAVLAAGVVLGELYYAGARGWFS